MKVVWYWQKSKQIDKGNRIESPDMDSHKYSQLIFDKAAKAILTVFSKSNAEPIGHPKAKKKKKKNRL